MSGIHSHELIRAERLMEEENFDEALQILDMLEKSTDLVSGERLQCYILRSILLNKLGKLEAALKLTDQIIRENQALKQPSYTVDALIQRTIALMSQGKFDEGLDSIKKAEKTLKILEVSHTPEFKRKKALVIHQKGTLYWYKGDLDQSLQLYQQSLDLRKEGGNKKDISASLNNIGLVYWQKGELTRSLEYLHKSLALKEGISNKQDIALSLNNLGIVYMQQGDLNQALEYYQRSRKLYEEINNPQLIARTLNNLGIVYTQKGEINLALECYHQSFLILSKIGNKQELASALDNLGVGYWHKGDSKRALEYLRQSLALYREIGSNFYISEALFNLISITSQINVFNEAQEYLQQLQTIEQANSNKLITQRYHLAHAMIMKAEDVPTKDLSFKSLYNILNQLVTANQLLRKIIIEEILDHRLTVQAIYNLCELLILELKTLGNEETLDEVKQITEKLYYIGQKQQSFSLLTKAYWLMAKLALLEQDVAAARTLLAKGLQLAEDKGYDRLAQIILTEQKLLTGQLPDWLVDQNISLLERLGQARLETLIVSLRQDRVESFGEEDLLPQTPSLNELKTFAEELGKRRIKW
ncbi:MAG: tetratricopeptide repeat protein [Candidatus Hodarchaeota archaeon]